MKPTNQLLRLAFAALALLTALAGLFWLNRIAGAEYEFRKLSQEYDIRKLAQNIKTAKLTDSRMIGLADDLKKLTLLDPSNGEIRNLYANTLSWLGDYSAAADQLQLARKTLNVRNSLFFLSDMYGKMGNIAEAERLMSACLLINPTDSEFNPAWLHLLAVRLVEMNRTKRQIKDLTEYNRLRQRFTEAALNWETRASNDQNAYLFLAEAYIDPLYPLQAYRCFLVGLSGASWLNLNDQAMVERSGALLTAQKIVGSNYAKAYKGLP